MVERTKTVLIRGLFDFPDFGWFRYHNLENIDFDIRTGIFQKYDERIDHQIKKCFSETSAGLVLVGHSYGCAMVHDFLTSCGKEYLERIKGIVLINSAMKGRQDMSIEWPYFFLRPLLYMLALVANGVFGTPIRQGLRYRDWDYFNTALPYISDYSEVRGEAFVRLVTEHGIACTNVMTLMRNVRIGGLYVPLPCGNTVLDVLVWSAMILTLFTSLLFSSSDGLLTHVDQWLPESICCRNISMEASHMSTIGMRLFRLGGRTRATVMVEEVIESACSQNKEKSLPGT